MRLIIGCGILSCAIALADTSAPAPERGAVLATLERTVCFGTCPSYRVTVFSDGRVQWEGASFVKVKGKATAKLTPAELAALRDAFRDAKYFARQDADCYDVTDNPSANTSFDDGKQKKSIKHYYGCRSSKDAPALTALENKIDAILGTERWVGTEAERRKANSYR
jgi:hypothetical protein